MKRLVLSFIFGFVFLLSALAQADQSTPLQVALWNPVQLFPEDDTVGGLRLNVIYGRNQDVSGVDLGIANSTNRHAKGLHVGGLINTVDQDTTGLQIGGLLNDVGQEMRGVQVAGIANGAGDMKGVQVGILSNYAEGDARGLQTGLVNADDKGLEGLQIGLWNTGDEDTTGVQIGLVNITETMYGGQLGLINIIKDGPVPFFPVINLGFLRSNGSWAVARTNRPSEWV